MVYGYYPKILKEYGISLPQINQTNIKNRVISFEKKRAYSSVTASVPTDNPVSDLNVASRKKGGRPKGTTNEKKIGTKISITNAKN